MSHYHYEQVAAIIDAVKTGEKIKVNTSKIVKGACEDIYQGETRQAASKFLVDLWAEADKEGVLPALRTILNRQSKAVHKEMGINEGQALTVKEGELILAAKRERASKEESKLVSMIKEFEAGADASMVAKMEEILGVSIASLKAS